VRCGPERRFGHADDRDAVFGVNMRAQPGPAAGIKVDVAVHHDQRELVEGGDDRPQRRQLTPVELTGPIRRDRRDDDGPGLGNQGESPIASGHHRRPGAAVVQIVHINGDEQRSSTRWRVGRERADFLLPWPVRR
jgi:hypothetical protein